MRWRATHWASATCAMLLASTLVPGLAAARTHAVLVGVSVYPALAKNYQLSGPPNDVRLFRELLLERGVAPRNIRLLADGVEGAVLPARQAILESLAALAGEVAPGDQVFVLLAGHGSRQMPLNPTVSMRSSCRAMWAGGKARSAPCATPSPMMSWARRCSVYALVERWCGPSSIRVTPARWREP